MCVCVPKSLVRITLTVIILCPCSYLWVVTLGLTCVCAQVEAQVDEYVRFHEYWLARRVTDASQGIPTYYTRYASVFLISNDTELSATIPPYPHTSSHVPPLSTQAPECTRNVQQLTPLQML